MLQMHCKDGGATSQNGLCINKNLTMCKCHKCKTELHLAGLKHAYENRQNKKLYCKKCATSSKSKSKTPNLDTFARVTYCKTIVEMVKK